MYPKAHAAPSICTLHRIFKSAKRGMCEGACVNSWLCCCSHGTCFQRVLQMGCHGRQSQREMPQGDSGLHLFEAPDLLFQLGNPGKVLLDEAHVLLRRFACSARWRTVRRRGVLLAGLARRAQPGLLQLEGVPVCLHAGAQQLLLRFLQLLTCCLLQRKAGLSGSPYPCLESVMSRNP